jgi:hypothetical protein
MKNLTEGQEVDAAAYEVRGHGMPQTYAVEVQFPGDREPWGLVCHAPQHIDGTLLHILDCRDHGVTLGGYPRGGRRG